MKCSVCKIEKEETEFSKNQKKCKRCEIEYQQKNYARRMIMGAKLADKKRGRVSECKYITESKIFELQEEQENLCCYCELKMVFGVGVSRKQANALTIERIDNITGHIEENCVLACHHCNVALSNVPFEIKKIYGRLFKEGFIKWCPGKYHVMQDDHILEPYKFSKRQRSSDGLYNYCKSCTKKQISSHKKHCV
jgi:hypothetical protein